MKECEAVEDGDFCPGPRVARGYCWKHYRRLLKYGSTDPRPPKRRVATCSVDDCTNLRYGVLRLCRTHYNNKFCTGDPLNFSRKKSPPGQWKHGVPSGYINYKCRCDLCRKACVDYYRDRQRANLALTRKARQALGLTRKEYAAKYGHGPVKAREILKQLGTD
jgi:hypothetical protein